MKRSENIKTDSQPEYKRLYSNKFQITSKLFRDNLLTLVNIKNASTLLGHLLDLKDRKLLKHQLVFLSTSKVIMSEKTNPFKGRAKDATDLIDSYSNIKLQSG